MQIILSRAVSTDQIFFLPDTTSVRVDNAFIGIVTILRWDVRRSTLSWVKPQLRLLIDFKPALNKFFPTFYRMFCP